MTPEGNTRIELGPEGIIGKIDPRQLMTVPGYYDLPFGVINSDSYDIASFV